MIEQKISPPKGSCHHRRRPGRHESACFPALPGWLAFGSRPSPGFPVELGGSDELHAPFFMERRTRGYLHCSVAGNPGPGLGRADAFIGIGCRFEDPDGRAPGIMQGAAPGAFSDAPSYLTAGLVRLEAVALVRLAARTTTFRLLGSVMLTTVLLGVNANVYWYRLNVRLSLCPWPLSR